jgi:chaperone modulatory protein CbpM
MKNNNLILIELFCLYNNVEISFMDSLLEYGLIDLIEKENNRYLLNEQLKEIEKMIDFHYSLNINIEGIDVITNLLRQINELQQELNRANNKLSFFDANI